MKDCDEDATTGEQLWVIPPIHEDNKHYMIHIESVCEVVRTTCQTVSYVFLDIVCPQGMVANSTWIITLT